MKKIALVTGANRGMGLATSIELAKQDYHVILVGRNSEQLINEVSKLIDSKLSAEFIIADITHKEDADKVIQIIKEKYNRLDVLVNNAGIYIEEGSPFKADEEIFTRTMETNLYGPLRLMKGLIPLMIANNYGRVVNVSSNLGSFRGASSHCLSYSVSKSALNMLTNLFAAEVSSKNIKINSICPGWVKTDMGGSSAPRTIEQGISGIVWAATLKDNGPSGKFFHDQKEISW